MRRRTRVFLVIALTAFVACAAAATGRAATYWSGYITSSQTCDGTTFRVCSGFNYWYATDTSKDPGTERVGFENSTTVKYVTSSEKYIYTDRVALGIGGYMKAFVRNLSGFSLYNNAGVCTC